jgi:uncharacterized membrane protein
MRKYLLTGLIVLLPLVLTLMILSFLFNFFTTPIAPIVTRLVTELSLPEGLALFLSRLLSLLFLCLFILFLGFFARYFLFKNAMSLGHKLMLRIPFVKSVYKVSREVISALFSSDGKQAFQQTVMMPFPHSPHFSIGFSAGPAAEECQKKTGKPLIAVFAPTAPHPISGFLFLVDPKDIKNIDMTKEDALKYLVSCGVIIPSSKTNP